MNILDLTENLKVLSDQQLSQAMTAPTGVPQYAIAAELNRRKQLRQEAGPQRPTTVVQELMMQQPSPMPMGEAIPRQAPPMGMKKGGYIDWTRVADVMSPLSGYTPYQTTQVNRRAAPNFSTPDLMEALRPILEEREKAVKTFEDGALNRALMQAGFAMMASKDPTALGGIGAGAMQGLAGWSADKGQAREEMARLADRRASMLDQMQRRAENEANRRGEWERGQQSADIVQGQIDSSEEQAIQNRNQRREEWMGEGPNRQAQAEQSRALAGRYKSDAERDATLAAIEKLAITDPKRYREIRATMNYDPYRAEGNAIQREQLRLGEARLNSQEEKDRLANVVRLTNEQLKSFDDTTEEAAKMLMGDNKKKYLTERKAERADLFNQIFGSYTQALDGAYYDPKAGLKNWPRK